MKLKDVVVPLLSILAFENIWLFTQVLEPVPFIDSGRVESQKGKGGGGWEWCKEIKNKHCSL